MMIINRCRAGYNMKDWMRVLVVSEIGEKEREKKRERERERDVRRVGESKRVEAQFSGRRLKTRLRVWVG